MINALQMQSPIKAVTVAALFTTLVLSAHAQTPADQPPLAYVCTFDRSAIAKFDPISGDKSHTVREDRLELTFAAIDLANSKAQLIGNQGAANVYAARAFGSLLFIEQTPSGNVNMTSILDVDASGRIRAVTSRHTIWPNGSAVFSQMTGTCLGKT